MKFSLLHKILSPLEAISAFSKSEQDNALRAARDGNVRGVFSALGLDPKDWDEVDLREIGREILWLNKHGGNYVVRLNTTENKRVLSHIIENISDEKVPASKILIDDNKNEVSFPIGGKKMALVYDKHMHFSDEKDSPVACYYFFCDFENWLRQSFKK